MGPGFESPEVHQPTVWAPNNRGSTERNLCFKARWESWYELQAIEGSAAQVSVFNAVGPPVPIPNTEVKRCSGENTWLATAREDSSTLTQKNSSGRSLSESVILTQWVHPFPFRTRKLSAAVVKILGWRRPGKIAHSRHKPRETE